LDIERERGPRAGRRYGGLLLHERRAGRRARLVDAGLEIFGTTGFQASTIPMLCTAAGVTARHFYEEFASREALLTEIYDEISAHVLECVRAVLADRKLGARERFRQASSAYFSYLIADPRRARIYAVESSGVSADLETRRQATRAAFVTMLVPQQRTVLAPHESRLRSVALAGAAHALLQEWVFANPAPTVDAMVDTLRAVAR
jgi:AcrR family transcriptional regulator